MKLISDIWEYILAIAFALGAVWAVVDAVKMCRKKEWSGDAESLFREYRQLFIYHRITWAVFFFMLVWREVGEIMGCM